MFSLFKRKKVADKKAMKPSMCDSGEHQQQEDNLHLQELGVREAVGRGYQKLRVPPPPPPPREGGGALPPPASPPRDAPSEHSSSAESSDTDGDAWLGRLMDTDDEDEELTCYVCERSFGSGRRLERHQLRLRHFMCALCDAIFDSLHHLEQHKHHYQHFADYELRLLQQQQAQGRSTDEDSDLEEHQVYSGNRRRDVLRRLLL